MPDVEEGREHGTHCAMAFAAARDGNIEELQRFITSGKNINAKNAVRAGIAYVRR